MKKSINRWGGLLPMAAVITGLTMSCAVFAQDKADHPGVTPGEMAYKGAPVPAERFEAGDNPRCAGYDPGRVRHRDQAVL